jgi:hypothetical protein
VTKQQMKQQVNDDEVYADVDESKMTRELMEIAVIVEGTSLSQVSKSLMKMILR